MRTPLALLSFVLLSISAHTATLNVPAQYPTIQAGIDAATTGDTVLVAPGTYVENIDFKGKAISVQSAKGPRQTVIHGSPLSLPVVVFISGEGTNSVLDGFTITGAPSGLPCPLFTASYGGGVCSGTFWTHSASPTIRNNIITGNCASAGGGIWFQGSPTIINNIIKTNVAWFNGGGIEGVGDASIRNNVIVQNNGDGIRTWSGSSTIANSIVRNNTKSQIALSAGVVEFCDVQGGHVGLGNIGADPQFVDEADGDYHLRFNSPCRNAGSNSFVTELFDFEGDPRIADGTVDMGADEFHRHLYFTGDPTPSGTVSVKLVGTPTPNPVALALGISVHKTPLSSGLGDWYVAPPCAFMLLNPVPATGVCPPLMGALPPTPTTPYRIYGQAIVNYKLTNLMEMYVE